MPVHIHYFYRNSWARYVELFLRPRNNAQFQMEIMLFLGITNEEYNFISISFPALRFIRTAYVLKGILYESRNNNYFTLEMQWHYHHVEKERFTLKKKKSLNRAIDISSHENP